MAKTAIILGATGLTGGELLGLLLKDDRYSQIILFSRNACGITNPKITEYIVDLFELEHYKNKFNADEVFCCIGTTKSKTSNKALYTKIDYGIPVSAALLTAENRIETFVVISSMGAKKSSKIFYNRTKGKMEEKVSSYGIKNTFILRPSLIDGERDEHRLGEKFAKYMMGLLKPLMRFGELSRYRPIHAETIAKTMIWLANNTYPSGKIKSKIIQEISDNA